MMNLIVAFEGIRDAVDVMILLNNEGLIDEFHRKMNADVLPVMVKEYFKRDYESKGKLFALNLTADVVGWCYYDYYLKERDFKNHEKIILRRKSHE